MAGGAEKRDGACVLSTLDRERCGLLRQQPEERDSERAEIGDASASTCRDA